MSFWNNLVNTGSDIVESIGEGAAVWVDGWTDLQLTKQREAAKDPEVMKKLEPTKGKAKDGSTVVATSAPAPQPKPPEPSNWIQDVDNRLVLGAGALVVAVLLLKK